MAGAPAGAELLSILIASSNVAALSEDRAAQFPSWISHLSSLLFPSSSPHDMIVLHLQEVGGVKWTAAKVQEFADRLQRELLAARVANEYWSTGLVIDMEASRFTALATVILIRRSSSSRFRRRHFLSSDLTPLSIDSSVLHTGLIPVAGHEYFRHEKFEGSTSRKGFLYSEWCLDGQVLCFVNVHLFHDDSNLVAMEAIPSVYASKRSSALRVVMQRLPASPALLAGDFNFRLDLPTFLAWLRACAPCAVTRPPASASTPPTSSSLSSSTSQATQQEHQQEASGGEFVLIQKDVFHCPYLDSLVRDVSHQATLLKHDQELKRFNQELQTTAASMCLHEDPISFPPTYPVEELNRWSSKRAPAWCDRVLYTPSCAPLFSSSHKRSYSALQATASTPLGSDHLPVYLHFRLALSAPVK